MDLSSRRGLFVRGAMLLLLCTGGHAQMPKKNSRPLPPFVEMMPGAKQVTESYFSNNLRVGGMVLLFVEEPPAAILTFYRGSMQRNGLTPGKETVTPKGVTVLKGSSADGKRELVLEVNPSKTSRIAIQLNYLTNK